MVNKFEVIDNKIFGGPTADNNLYMVCWERSANSGFIYVWADSEQDAFKRVGFSPKYVKHTIVKIDINSLPVVVGVAQ